MLDYAMRRVLLLFLTLFLGSIALFLALRLLPERDAVEILLTNEVIAEDPGLADAQRKALGIYGPLHEQYFRWASGFVTGDWGRSLASKRPIFDELKNRIPVSFEIAFFSLFITWTVSFPSSDITQTFSPPPLIW